MGLCASSSRVAPKRFSKVEEEELLLKYPKLQKSMCLSDRDFVSLYGHFVAADVEEKGCIRYRHFLDYFDLERTPFSKRVFEMFTLGEKAITFKAWVFGLWNYCTSDNRALTMFAFAMYNQGGKPSLDKDDVFAMLRELFGEKFLKNKFARSLMGKLMTTDHIGRPVAARVTPAQFATVANQAKNLLYKPFFLQSKLQDRVMGRSWWLRVADERSSHARSGTFNVEEVKEILEEGLEARLDIVNGTIVVK